MTSDYHIHTSLCKHASGAMEEYVQQAVKIGLDEIAFTDHIPLPNGFDVAHRMLPEEMDAYLKEIEHLQKAYPQIKILGGIEADFYDGFETYLCEFLDQYKFDLVILSVHFINGWPKGNWAFSYSFSDKTQTEIYNDYLSALLRGVQTGLFNIIGHLDLVKSAAQPLLQENSALIKQILTEAKKQNMAIEINTSGLRREIAEPYPAFSFLPLIAEAGLPLTLGSDAHEPKHVGFAFPEIEARLSAFPKIKRARFRAGKISIAERKSE